MSHNFFSRLLLALVPIILLWKLNSLNCLFQDETPRYIKHYLGESTAVDKIFDIRVSDNLIYRARELHNFFNLLDYSFYGYLNQNNINFTLSVVYIFFLVLICILFIFWSEELYTKKSNFNSNLLLLVYLTSPVVIFSSTLFRTAKIGASLFVALSAYFSFKLLRKIYFSRKKDCKSEVNLMAMLGVSMLLASCFDEIGFFWAINISLVMGALIMINPKITNENKLKSLACLSLPIMIYLIYKHFVGPFFANLVNGVDSLPWMPVVALKQSPSMFANIYESFIYAINSAGSNIGASGALGGLFYIACLLYMGKKFKIDTIFNKKLGVNSLIIFLVLSATLMFHLMTYWSLNETQQIYSSILKSPIYSIWYYPLPWITLFLFIANCICSAYQDRTGKYSLFTIFYVVLISGNIIFLAKIGVPEFSLSPMCN